MASSFPKVLPGAPQTQATGEEDTANVPKRGAPQGTHRAARDPGQGFFLQIPFLGTVCCASTRPRFPRLCLTYRDEFCLGNNFMAKLKAFGICIS